MRVETIDNQKFILLEKETVFSLGYRITIDKDLETLSGISLELDIVEE